jgi:acyl-CoA hydrolase
MSEEQQRDLTPGRSEASHLVMPNDTNPLGTLFGGRAVEWMDIAAGLAAIRLSHRHVVTASIERLDFHVPIRLGNIALVEAQVVSVGRTSVVVRVDMFRDDPKEGTRELCTSGLFHMVALDDLRRPAPVFR